MGDFILHGNWMITAVYGHQVFHFPCKFDYFLKMRMNDINIFRMTRGLKLGFILSLMDKANLFCTLNLLNV